VGLGVLKGVMDNNIPINAVFAFALAENTIDGDAYRPSDILKSMKGLTVENNNPDAEGRLVLSDAFTYVQWNYKPEVLIDQATLTGAAKVAMGYDCSAYMTNEPELGKEM
jgi:leucyl aminopeptidase